MRRKHVPQRTCVACRRVKPKRELMRVVCVPDGTVQVDESGKAHGRGAYLCRDRACWEKGISKGGALAHSLRVTLSEADRIALLDYARQLPVAVSQDRITKSPNTVEKDGP